VCREPRKGVCVGSREGKETQTTRLVSDEQPVSGGAYSVKKVSVFGIRGGGGLTPGEGLPKIRKGGGGTTPGCRSKTT